MSLLGDLGTAVKNKLGGTSVDNTVPRYNGTTCTMQGSGVTISDTNVVTASGGFVGSLTGNASTATTSTTATTATNATKLNDAVESTTSAANTIVKRDASGYVYVAALNSTLADTTTAATHYYCETGSDGWLRPKTLANVKAEIAGDKAPLASPALTGTPTAPTAAVGTNTTQIATTAFVLANSKIPYSAGTYKQIPTTSALNFTNTSWQKKITWISPNSGAITTSMTIYKVNDFGYTLYGRIYVNDVARGAIRSKSGSIGSVTFTEDITVNAGDKVQVYAYTTNSSYFGDIPAFNIYSTVGSLTNWVQE